jgi:hypothetical protein
MKVFVRIKARAIRICDEFAYRGAVTRRRAGNGTTLVVYSAMRR